MARENIFIRQNWRFTFFWFSKNQKSRLFHGRFYGQQKKVEIWLEQIILLNKIRTFLFSDFPKIKNQKSSFLRTVLWPEKKARRLEKKHFYEYKLAFFLFWNCPKITYFLRTILWTEKKLEICLEKIIWRDKNQKWRIFYGGAYRRRKKNLEILLEKRFLREWKYGGGKNVAAKSSIGTHVSMISVWTNGRYSLVKDSRYLHW